MCPPEKFDCGDSASKCISSSWRCDGERDCENGADEDQCSAGKTEGRREEGQRGEGDREVERGERGERAR